MTDLMMMKAMGEKNLSEMSPDSGLAEESNDEDQLVVMFTGRSEEDKHCKEEHRTSQVDLLNLLSPHPTEAL